MTNAFKMPQNLLEKGMETHQQLEALFPAVC